MFSDLLRRDRERYGLSLEDAARSLGVARPVYEALEAAERWPDWDTYDRIAAAFASLAINAAGAAASSPK
jgi:transcriptional regulator with XRE-family HTH domain